MSEPFVGEIRMVGFNFPPRGWAFCNGQFLNIQQNKALSSLYGTIYGGDGRETFALPDLRGRLPIHQGQGAGISNRPLGSKGGSEEVSLHKYEMPSHNHVMRASTATGTDSSPKDNLYAVAEVSGSIFSVYETDFDAEMNTSIVENAGYGQPHTNLMPYLCIYFIVALVGTYPSQV